jgi:CRP-like cAMP-binding protein
MATETDTLSRVPLFRDVEPSTIERIATVARQVVVPVDFEVVREGDDGLGFFVVTDGELDVIRGQTRLQRLKAGDYFGEMALLDDQPRAATVKAATESRCLALYRWDFLNEVRRDPDLALALLSGLSHRLRDLDERYASIR